LLTLPSPWYDGGVRVVHSFFFLSSICVSAFSNIYLEKEKACKTAIKKTIGLIFYVWKTKCNKNCMHILLSKDFIILIYISFLLSGSPPPEMSGKWCTCCCLWSRDVYWTFKPQLNSEDILLILWEIRWFVNTIHLWHFTLLYRIFVRSYNRRVCYSTYIFSPLSRTGHFRGGRW
jgi:hypothetical protein